MLSIADNSSNEVGYERRKTNYKQNSNASTNRCDYPSIIILSMDLYEYTNTCIINDYYYPTVTPSPTYLPM